MSEPAAEAAPEPTPEGPMPLSEWDIRPFVWFNDLYIMEGTEVSDYLQYVSLIDEEAVTGVTVDAEAVDTAVVGDYDLTYTAAVNRDLYDAYIAARDALVAYEVPADDESEVWRIDNVEYQNLEKGKAYTLLTRYLLTPVEAAEEVLPALLQDEDGNIMHSAMALTPEGNSGEVHFRHEIDASLIPEGMAATPEYFLLAADGDNEQTEVVEVVRVVHVVSAEDFDEITTSGGVVSVGDGVATAAGVVEIPAASPDGDANTETEPLSAETPQAERSTDTAAVNSADMSTVATPKPTATPKPSPSSGSTTGGGTSTKPAHTHSYTSALTTAATCTSAGVRTYTCSCGASYTESIPATGHKWTTTTETITIPESGHYSEEITGWNTVHHDWYYECLKCGCQTQDGNDITNHSADCGASYHSVPSWDEQVPIYGNVRVVDTPASTQSLTTTTCSVCGATQ